MMKTKIYSMILLMGAAMASCSDNWSPNVAPEAGVGHLAKASLAVANGENVISRAASVSTDDFIVKVFNASSEEIGSWNYATMPEIIDLPAGTGYTIKAYSHEQEAQAWDKPYYEGTSNPFAITANEVKEISPITCEFANVAVTINYSNSLREKLTSDCKVNVVANDKGELDFIPSETRTGYFKVIEGSNTLVATFSGTIDGSFVSISKTYTDVKPKNHYYITYSLKAPSPDVPDETGNIEIDPATGITIITSIDEVSVPGNVNIEEDKLSDDDRPGKEEGGEDPTPGGDDPITPSVDAITFESSTLNLDGGINDPSDPKFENEAAVVIKAEKGIQHLWVHISSDSEDFIASAGAMVPFDFDLANPVVNGVDWSDGLGANGLGFPVGSEVVNAPELTFDIVQFVPLLAGFPGNHNFVIEVTDNDGNVKSVTLKFVA